MREQATGAGERSWWWLTEDRVEVLQSLGLCCYNLACYAL